MSSPQGPQVDIEVSDLLRKHAVPEAVPDYLLSFSTPITSLSSVACLGESPELLDQLLKDAGISALPKVLATRAFFREAQAKFAASLVSFVPLAVLGLLPSDLHQPRRAKRALDSDSESDVDPDVRRGLLDEFSKRFGFHVPVFLQASDRLIKKLARHHRKKIVSFISLAEISTAADLRVPDQEVKISFVPLAVLGVLPLGKNKKLVAQDQKKKRGKFNAFSHSFLNALETLFLGYLTVSMADPRDQEWFSLSVVAEYLIFVPLAVLGVPPLDWYGRC